MTTLSFPTQNPFSSVAIPFLLATALAGGIMVKSGVWSSPAPEMPAPVTVTVPAGSYDYRETGEFFRDGFAVDGPKVTKSFNRPMTIMKHQVSTAAYDECVADGACPSRESRSPSQTDLPVTGVNYDDANAYARWLSERTGMVWRLPSDEELAFAAGSKYPDDALGVDPDSRNPALRWLADYERETARKASRVKEPQPYGSFGESENGLADFAGNIWEWTSSCLRRVNLDRKGRSVGEAESCGIYIAAGKHRAPLSSFVRDPKGGGCSVGTPPDNVGFRLVRDDRWYAPVLFAISRQPM